MPNVNVEHEHKWKEKYNVGKGLWGRYCATCCEWSFLPSKDDLEQLKEYRKDNPSKGGF